MEKPGDFAITYICTAPKCGNQQTIKYFANENPLPVTCCVKCRAGFGVALDAQLNNKIGMFPVPQSLVVVE